jgi:hypothetical protein
MIGTDLLHPQLMGHAQDQAQIQQTLQPPQPDAESAPAADGAAQPSDAGAPQ